MKNFCLIGAAGYVAPRHMQAIKKTNNNLVGLFDPNDSVGIIDSYFPNAKYFKEFERFDRFVDKIQRYEKDKIQFVSICSPNYLHDSHIRFSLRSGADVICEKPLVLNPWNLDGLAKMEKETKKKVFNILQLRVHPSILKLKKEINSKKNKTKYNVDLTYITSRGEWYLQSWKGDINKSGGIATNIGVHFFDMLHFIFGKLQQNITHLSDNKKASGFLEYENARVRWYLSLNREDIPKNEANEDKTTYRSITINGKEIEFSGGFTDLHLKSYQEILANNGFGLNEARTAIETVAEIRNSKINQSKADQHPFMSNSL